MQRGDESDLGGGGTRVVDGGSDVTSGVRGAAEPGQRTPTQPRLNGASVAVGEFVDERGEFLAEPVDHAVWVGG
jgi:hypothetical protein